MRENPVLPLVLAAALSAAGGAAHARVRAPGFEESLKQAVLEVRERRAGGRRPLSGLLGASERVFAASPRAALGLGHLRAFVGKRFDPGDDWSPAHGLTGGSARRVQSGLVDGVVFWHMAQHLYDGQAPERAAAEALGLRPRETLEGEMRAWRVGCLFWQAGLGSGQAGAGGDEALCLEEFPVLHYCRYFSAVELVVLSARDLKALGAIRPGADLEAFDRTVGAYCAEWERVAGGDPLSLEGFRPLWSRSQCLERAAAVVLSPGWKSSDDLCPAGGRSGNAAREAAREFAVP